jgi:glycosyltransferase involved in cell wall biosynthesis
MEKQPTISVIIPAFNASAFIHQCIENMLSQTYKNLEIIVVDDGSTDNTTELANQYPVKLIRQENQGVSVARNAGLAAATGEYLHFMDVDDFINLNFYEKMLDAIASVNADMALTGYVHERMPGFTSFITEKFLYINHEDKFIFTNVYNQGQVWKYLFKTSFLKDRKLTFDTTLRTSQDRVFAFQAVFYSNKIVTAPGTLYYYKERGNSLRTSATKEKIKRRNEFVSRANAFCENFAQQHHINVFRRSRCVTYQYKFLGAWLFKKEVYYTGRIKWYVLGVRILQRKQSHTL